MTGNKNSRLRDKVRKGMIDMDDPAVSQDTKDNIEFILDMSNPTKHELKMQLKKNETRAKEQQDLRSKILANDAKKNKTDRIDANVLLIYIDNISRAHFIRMLPRTVAWLSRFVDNKNEKQELFQFFRYHSVYMQTHTNNNALYYGQVGKVKHSKEDLFDSFSNNGYMTGMFKDGWETHVNAFKDKKLQLHHWDHLAGTVGCDKNFDYEFSKEYFDFGEPFATKGRGSIFRHCIYNHDMHDLVFEYATQFWEAYPDNRKFFRTHFSDAHEALGELITHLDDDLVSFLDNFERKGYLDDTIVAFISDHGAHNTVVDIPFIPDNGKHIENTHPVFMHLVPKNIPNSNLEYLRLNEQAFMSNHDFYSTMKSVAEGKLTHSRYSESYSYMHEELPKIRDWTNTTMFLAKWWCFMDKDYAIKQKDEIPLFRTLISELKESNVQDDEESSP